MGWLAEGAGRFLRGRCGCCDVRVTYVRLSVQCLASRMWRLPMQQLLLWQQQQGWCPARLLARVLTATCTCLSVCLPVCICLRRLPWTLCLQRQLTQPCSSTAT